MVDKKTSAIAVLCVVTVLCLGLWANADQKARTLEGELEALGDRYDSLNAEYVKVVEDHTALKSKYDSLKEDYDELHSIGVIAESAEWVLEDERLKVTSELLVPSGTSWWVTYTIRVTIMNIGDEPLDRVVIFVFPYKDGKFAETYSGYNSHTVENIYIGETYSYNFTGLPDDMTSYKVLAVAG